MKNENIDVAVASYRRSSLPWWLAAAAMLAPPLIPSSVWAADPIASPKSAGQSGLVSQFELIEIGGTFGQKNLAAASAGAVSFSLNNHDAHQTQGKLNDGKYGNPSTWIGSTDRSFAGVRFKQKEKIAAIAFGRDNNGKVGDRCLGQYCIQYSQAPKPDADTTDDHWHTIATIDYVASPPPQPSRRHLFRFAPVDATAIRVITQRNSTVSFSPLGIDELEVYSSDDIALAKKDALPWKPKFVDPFAPYGREKWVNPLVKKGYLGSPLVEVTPFVFKDRLYLLENNQKFWDVPGAKPGHRFHEDEVRIRDTETGKIVSVALTNHAFATALVHKGRVYVFAGDYGKDKPWRRITEIRMTSSSDLKTWTKPVTVIKAEPGELIYNTAVCFDGRRFVLLYETNDRRWPTFTFKYCENADIDEPNGWKRIDGAVYGRKKYVGGPALYFEGGWYYTLYLESLGRGRYETRITRSNDLKNWQDAPKDRPFITFDPTRTGIPLRPKQTRECNASDAELCYHKGKTIVYFTGSDQKVAGDLQRATYDGTPSELLAAFFFSNAKTDLVAPKHQGDWIPVLIGPKGGKTSSAEAHIESLRRYRPTVPQLTYQGAQLGAFIHFNLSTYLAGLKPEDHKAELFNPARLDANQWAKTAKSFGAKHVVLTAKHHNGYCLWPTKTTKHSVVSSPWKDGKGDVVREFVDACRKQGLRPGLYISGGDMHFKCHSTAEKFGKRHMVGDVDAYFKIFMQQLEELVTGYGPLAVIWFDGAYDPFGWDVMDKSGKRLGTAHGDAIAALVRKHQPGAVIFHGTQPDVRWSGSERGWAPYPLWNVIREGEGPRQWIGPDDFGYVLAEANLHTRSGWFWAANNDHTLMPVGRLMQAYYASIGRGANLLVNMTPDNRGLIPKAEVQQLADFGKQIQRELGKPVARTDSRRGWTKGGILVLELDSKQTINRIVLEEDLAQGQRVLAYELDARVDGEWRSLAKGLSIGRKRIHLFRPVTADRLRLRIVRAADVPVISTFAAYSNHPEPKP